MDNLRIQNIEESRFLFEGKYLQQNLKGDTSEGLLTARGEPTVYKSVVFFLNQDAINEAQKEMLNKIVKAIKINPIEVDIIPIIQATTLLPDIAQQAGVEKAIFLGYSGLQEKNLNVIMTLHRMEYIFTAPIDLMLKDPAIKVPFWNSLKVLFNV